MPLKKEKVKKVCLECGKEFQVYPYREKTARFCSLSCVSKYEIKKGIIKPYKWQKGQHISPETEFKKGHIPWNKGKPYLAIRGEKHWNWNGGSSRKGYPPEFDKRLKEKIRKVFNYTCVRCGIQERQLTGFHRKLVIHHIDYDRNNNNENNLVPLCRKCNFAVEKNKSFYLNIF